MKQLRRFIFAGGIALICSACAVRPTAEHPAQPPEPMVSPAPTLALETRLTMLSGRAIVTEDIIEMPIRHLTLELLNGNHQLVAETVTNGSGEFSFRLELKSGSYLIRPRSTKYSGELSVLIAGHDLEGLALQVRN